MESLKNDKESLLITSKKAKKDRNEEIKSRKICKLNKETYI
ncbi:hypothetical protein BCAH1134_C0564 (plasmid) [Bacillus cereus AH1134]|nr:hypothetical protein BCAH1134_C0564 [Bacillus cereus AH1134]